MPFTIIKQKGKEVKIRYIEAKGLYRLPTGDNILIPVNRISSGTKGEIFIKVPGQNIKGELLYPGLWRVGAEEIRLYERKNNGRDMCYRVPVEILKKV